MRARAIVAAALALLTLTLVPAAASAAARRTLGASPPGANDFGCRPSPARPYPVVLVHGTFGDQTFSWNYVSPALRSAGYCVFALDYGDRATGPIERSAQQLSQFVDRVLAATGAAKVSLVGHSQGGMMPRYYVRFLGGDQRVDDLVGLAPSNHGTTAWRGWNARQRSCTACRQQAAGSPFLQRLNEGDETPGTVSYTVVETRFDEFVVPYTSAFLGGGATNVLLQEACPLHPVEHGGVVSDHVVMQWILNALGQPGPADPAFRPRCL